MAPSSAFSVRSFLISRSIAGAMSLSYASSMAPARTSFVFGLSFVITFFFRYAIMSSTGASIFTVNIFSFSPLFMARVLCPATFDNASSNS